MPGEVGGVNLGERAQRGLSEEGAGVGEVTREEREDLGREGGEEADEGDIGLRTRFLEMGSIFKISNKTMYILVELEIRR